MHSAENSATSPPRAWAEINLSALSHNLNVAKESTQKELMLVLKAGAYGHDIKVLCKFLDQENVAFFGLASVIEARKVRDSGCKTRVYLLGATFPEERQEIVENRWSPCISSLDEALHFNELNANLSPLPIHIAVDTGMGRGGFMPQQLSKDLVSIKKLPNLFIEGIGSHLPSADEDKAFTLQQYQLFENTVKACNTKFKYVHLENSAGILDYESNITNLVRPGLMLYGISPLVHHQQKLKPVMSLKSRISIIRDLPAGHGISYGRSTLLETNSKVATIGIGYGDGYPRSLSNRNTEVMIRDTRCPILGRVTMDQIMVDVSHLSDLNAGDEVELFGNNILASEIAEKAGTIPWEIFTRITPRVKKVYI